MPVDYAQDRNVQVFDHKFPPNVVAGFIQHGSVSIATFFQWLQTVLTISTEWTLFPATSDGVRVNGVLKDDSATLAHGNYVVLAPDGSPLAGLGLTTERHRPRTLSLNLSGTPRSAFFCERVRSRDGRCCVTQARVFRKYFGAHRAAHIFPIAHTDVWNMLNLRRFISDDEVIPGQEINSVQNGFLLRSDVHDAFDDYLVAINPDDGYRIIDFRPGGEFDGHILWRNTSVDPKYQLSDDLLREHFHQCILANVRGAGERDDLDWDREVQEDLANFVEWGKPTIGGCSRLELELGARLYHTMQDGER